MPRIAMPLLTRDRRPRTAGTPPQADAGWAGPAAAHRGIDLRLRVNPRTVARWSRQGSLASMRTLGGHHRYRHSQTEVDRLLAQPLDPGPPSQGGDADEQPARTAGPTPGP